jgi:uncharacterized membrane protein YecN with MAPEG domain
MSNSYAIVSALIFAVVAIMHVVRLINQWPVAIGPYNVSMNVSWVALVVAALIAIWGFMQLG